MDKYIVGALLLVPGFIAMRVATLLGQPEDKASDKEYIISYIVFGTLSNLLSAFVATALGILPSWSTIDEAAASFTVSNIVVYSSLSVFVSAALGIIWACWLAPRALSAMNWLGAKRGLSPYYYGSLLSELFDDGQPHFIIVKKDGEDIGVGFYESADEKTQAISILEHPIYREWLKAARNGAVSPLSKIIRTFYDASTGLLIYETDFPPEWGEPAD